MISILLLLSALLLGSYLGKLSLIDPDEPRYAESAREMLILKNYLIPQLNFQPRVNKPIFFYWLVALSYQLFGISEFSARLPSLFFGVILVLIIYLWLREEIGQKEAFLSALIALSTPAIFIVSRIAITDMVYTTFLLLSLFSFWKSSRNRKFLKRAYFFLALSLLTKGPAGAILIFLTFLAFSFWQRERSLILRIFSLKGFLFFLFLGGFWYCFLLSRIGWREFLALAIKETWGRMEKGFVHWEPFYYYIPLLLIGFLPWSVFLPSLSKLDWKDRFNRFLFTFLLVTFLFFSFCRSKLPTYILPIFPALAILTARFFYRFWDQTFKNLKYLFWMSIFFSIWLYFFLPRLSNFVQPPALLKVMLAICLLSLPLLFLLQARLKYQFCYLFILPFLFYYYLLLSFGDEFSDYRSSKALFQNQQIDSDTVYTLNLFEPSIVFYSQKKVEEIQDLSQIGSGYLVIRKEKFPELKAKQSSWELISESKKYYLLRLQKLQN